MRRAKEPRQAETARGGNDDERRERSDSTHVGEAGDRVGGRAGGRAVVDQKGRGSEGTGGEGVLGGRGGGRRKR